MKSAIIYILVSTKEDINENIDEVSSILNQLEGCTLMAKKNNLDIIKRYIDSGELSLYGVQPELENAITFCEHNEVNYFITWDTLRLSRDSSKVQLIESRLNIAHTKIKTISDGFSSDT